MADLVVAGAGVIGASVAWRAARAGLDVALCDPRPGRGSTWAAGGMIAAVTEARPTEPALLRANLAANASWPAFAEELEADAGLAVGHRACGALVVARDADELAELDRVHDDQEHLGLAVERRTGRQLRRLEPALAPSIRGGLDVPSDQQVDNRALAEALPAAAEAAGARLLGQRITHVEIVEGRVAGAWTEDGQRLAAPWVVLAAGHETATIAGVPTGALPPIRPVKGQLLHLRVRDGEAPLASRTIRARTCYVVSREDGRFVVGATSEERGVDRSVTAGAVRGLLRDAYELLPGIDEAELTETTVGLRPATPDNAPVVGPVGPDGLVVATGHYRHGLLLAPLTAEAVTELVVDGVVGDGLAAFSPDRFREAS